MTCLIVAIKQLLSRSTEAFESRHHNISAEKSKYVGVFIHPVLSPSLNEMTVLNESLFFFFFFPFLPFKHLLEKHTRDAKSFAQCSPHNVFHAVKQLAMN